MRYWEALEYAKKIGSDGLKPDPERMERALFGWKDAKKDSPPEGVATVYLVLAQGWATLGTAAYTGFAWRDGFGDSIDVLFWMEPPKPPRRTWYCPTCEKEVPAEEVTFEDTHDERHGGCGGHKE